MRRRRDPAAGRQRRHQEVDDNVWQVTFMDYDLGFFDLEQDRVVPDPNPFTPDKLLAIWSL